MSIYYAIEFDQQTMQKLKQKQLEVKQGSIKGDFVQPETFHITVLFCVGGTSGYSRTEYINALDEYKKRFNPRQFNIQLENYGQFENSKDGNVVWVGLKNSFPLYEIKKNLEDTIKSLNVHVEKSQFSGYTPHITMAYDATLKDDFDVKFEDSDQITIDSISLWDSFKANGTHIYNKVHEIKLGL